MQKNPMLHFTHQPPVPVIGFVASSGSGKTTLIEKLLPLLHRQSIRVAVIKHSHHSIQFDKPGKDSYRFSQAGAQQMLLDSPNGWSLTNNRHTPQEETPLNELIQHLDLNNLDLIIVEGFKEQPFDKIEVYRHNYNQTPLALHDHDIIAICTDKMQELNPQNETKRKETKLKQIDLNNPSEVLSFILEHTQLNPLNTD